MRRWFMSPCLSSQSCIMYLLDYINFSFFFCVWRIVPGFVPSSFWSMYGFLKRGELGSKVSGDVGTWHTGADNASSIKDVQGLHIHPKMKLNHSVCCCRVCFEID